MSLLELLLVKEDRMRNEELCLKDEKNSSRDSKKTIEFSTQTDDSPVISKDFTVPVFMSEGI